MVYMTKKASEGQHAQVFSLHPDSCQLLVWLVAIGAASCCHLCLPTDSGDKVWLSAGSWEMKEILVAACSSLSESRGILRLGSPISSSPHARTGQAPETH